MKVVDYAVKKLRVPLGRVIGDNNCAYDTFDVSYVTLTTEDGHVGHGLGETVHKGTFAKPVSWKSEMPNVQELAQEFETQAWPELKGRSVDELMASIPCPWEPWKVKSYLHASVRMALWDLKGKVAGKPLYQILGGTPEGNDIFGYSSPCGYPQATEWLTEYFKGKTEAGFKAIKVKVGNPNIDLDMDRLKRVRDAVGPDVQMSVDGNTGWDGPGTLKWLERLDQEGITLHYVEDPIWPDDLDGFRLLAKESPMKIVGHDYIPNPYNLRPLLDTGAISQIRMRDGIDHALGSYKIAEEYDLSLIQCNTFGEHSVHFSVSHKDRVERMEFANIGWNDLYETPVTIVNGRIQAPELPGLGLTPATDKITEWSVED